MENWAVTTLAMTWRHAEITDAIDRALAEDIGPGDVTTEACVPPESLAEGAFVARESMILAGIELLPLIYKHEEVTLLHTSGDRSKEGDLIARVRGKARRLLTLERTALNFLQRLSGVATLASQFVGAVAGTGCRILDTRKTTPGLRRLEKLAAQAGGVTNHRIGLYDAILIKNNHIMAARGVRQALLRVRDRGLPMEIPIEIEVRTLEELDEALDFGAELVLLDNFSPQEAGKAVARIDGRAKVEISGGVTLATVRTYAETGADFVSAGAITHSARAVDISFRLAPSEPCA